MRPLKGQTVGIRSTGELLHPAQYPFIYFTSSSSGSYLHLASSSYLWLKSVPPSEISILQYALSTWNRRCRFNGIWRRAARRMFFHLWSIDYGKSCFVPLSQKGSCLLSQISFSRRRQDRANPPSPCRLWMFSNLTIANYVQTSIVETLMARRPEREPVIWTKQ